jgi:hypothetical protein
MSQFFPEPEPDDTVPAPPPAPNPVYVQNRPGWQTTLTKQIDQGQQGLVKWFYEAGIWIFSLLTITSVILSVDLILLGNADHATLISGLAVAIGLPFSLVGLWLAYYLKTGSQTVPAPAKKLVIDSTALITLIMGTLFTLVSLGSALWRISWVVTLLFLVAAIVGLWLILRVVRSA